MLYLPFLTIFACALPVWANCSRDNLLRGLERADAWPYCASLLGPDDPRVTIAPPPAVATYAPERMTSACSCLLSLSSSPSSSLSSTRTTSWDDPVYPSSTSACEPESTRSSSTSSSTRKSTKGPKSRTTRTPYAARPTTFTGITITGAMSASGCYALPTPTASLRESRLNNTDRDPPYVDAIYFDQNATRAKYIRVVDEGSNSLFFDFSDPDRFALQDKDGNSLVIDSKGIHFASATCSVNVEILIHNLFGQINHMTNTTCPDVASWIRNTTSIDSNNTGPSSGGLQPRLMALSSFFVLLRMKDQCGEPLRADLPPTVRIGPLPCETLPGPPGVFVASCSFPASSSTEMRCESSVDALLSRLARGRLPGACPRLTTVWTLLLDRLAPYATQTALFAPFLDASPRALTTVAAALDRFLDLYGLAADFFASTTRGQSALEDTVASHGGAQSLRRQACRALHAAPTAYNLTLRAGGGSQGPRVLAALRAAPNATLEYDRRATDPAQRACCANPGRCVVDGAERYYGREALVAGSDCICGRTAGEGQGIAFRTGLCRGYDACDAEKPCGEGMACLVDNCCGTNICVNATECNGPAEGRGLAALWVGEDARGD